MRLGTISTDAGTHAVVVRDDTLVDTGHADVGALLQSNGWREAVDSVLADPSAHVWPMEDAVLAPVVPRPSKIVGVGLNYAVHTKEMGCDPPDHPTLFAKVADTLVGPRDDIIKPAETSALDWEVELAVIIGTSVRRADESAAEQAIAGFCAFNDVTCRDWQYRTLDWFQGKNWAQTAPIGPYLVTPDELPGGVRPELLLTLRVDGELMQSGTTADLVFDPVDLVRYISAILPLHPGDVVATGTPRGVGHTRNPQRYLKGGELVVAEIEGVGRLENRVVAESGG